MESNTVLCKSLGLLVILFCFVGKTESKCRALLKHVQTFREKSGIVLQASRRLFKAVLNDLLMLTAFCSVLNRVKVQTLRIFLCS